MQDYSRMLKEFHDKYGQYRRGDANPGLVPITVAMLRLRLMVEELGELAEACSNGDPVEIADGLGDLAYVTLGTIVAYGLEAMDETPGYTSLLTYDEVAGYLSPLLGKVACAMHEHLTNLEPEDGDNLKRVIVSLDELLRGIINAAEALNIPFDAVFREIHASNMTKAVPTISSVPGRKYGQKLGVSGKGPDYRPPNLRPILGLV